MAQSQGIGKQAFAPDPPMLILQSPAITTLTSPVLTQMTRRLQTSLKYLKNSAPIFSLAHILPPLLPPKTRTLAEDGRRLCSKKGVLFAPQFSSEADG